MIVYLLRWIATLAIAFVAGKLMTKIKMPSILGWLIVGMLLGPRAFGLIFAFWMFRFIMLLSGITLNDMLMGVSFTAAPASFPLSDLKISLQPETYSLLISQQHPASGNSTDPADKT